MNTIEIVTLIIVTILFFILIYIFLYYKKIKNLIIGDFGDSKNQISEQVKYIISPIRRNMNIAFSCLLIACLVEFLYLIIILVNLLTKWINIEFDTTITLVNLVSGGILTYSFFKLHNSLLEKYESLSKTIKS